MKNGEFPEGSKTLRAKIDMASPNLDLRDPVIYRILHKEHPKTGNQWKIYPSYDFAHGQSDSIEGITHSLCTLEFEHHRPLYDWFCENLGIHHPQQIEFACLNMTYVVMSKRKMLRLVEEGHVKGWDDPRMATLQGMRRRGYTPEAIREFAERVGLAKRENTIEVELRALPAGGLEQKSFTQVGCLESPQNNHRKLPRGPNGGNRRRQQPGRSGSRDKKSFFFGREIFIDRNDFMEDPPKKYFRLSPDKEVRLKYAYYATCKEVIKNEDGEIKELICTYDPESRGGDSPDGRKVKGTIQWVDASTAIPVEARLYDRLFLAPNPEESEEGGDFTGNLNPDSLEVNDHALIESSVRDPR